MMFKTVLTGLTFLGMALMADALPDLSQYRQLTDKDGRAVLVENFDSGTEGWNLTPTCRWEPKDGMTGTGALVVSRTDPKQRILAKRNIHLEKDVTYRIRFNYRMQQTEQPRV